MPQQGATAEKVRAENLSDLIGIGVEAGLCAENTDGEDYQVYLLEFRSNTQVIASAWVSTSSAFSRSNSPVARPVELELVNHRRHPFVVTSEQQRLELTVPGEPLHDRDTDLR